jgi:3-oxoacyl-(acyl-carrier-protein) synthase
MNNRVVITGMGVVSPNGVGLPDFMEAIKLGKSGITHHNTLEELNFSCQIAGTPLISEEKKLEYFKPVQLRNFNSTGILYGVIAAIDAWKDAGLIIDESASPDWYAGIIFGAGSSGVDKFREAIYKIDDKNVRRLGSTAVLQTMSSGVSAYLGGMLGLGNQVTTNSAACTTGAESILMGYERIKAGYAKKMLVGSCSDSGPYIWGGFDAMKVCTYKNNNTPTKGSRPMSASASGFVPSSGAGALVLESLEQALERKAPIYAEIIGGNVNSGGQRNGGSLTAPNADAVQRCIKMAVKNAKIDPKDIDTINGHLTATIKDPEEIGNWSAALGLSKENFPPINSLKSMIGHGLSASGAIEAVATVLQIKNNFVFPNINCEDLHPQIEALIGSAAVPQQLIEREINIAAKASFGFGDVNACVIFKSYLDE